MNHDDGRGSRIDVRARRASRDLRHEISELLRHARADLERFDRIRDLKQRTERRKVIAVAALVAIAGAFSLLRAFPPREEMPSRPAPPPASGLIVFGRSAPGLDQRSLFTVAPDGSNERRLPITYTDCGEWSPDGSLLHVTASEFPGAPLRPAVVKADGSDFEIFETDAPSSLHLGCGDWSPDGDRLVLEGFGSSTLEGVYTVEADDGSDLTRLTHGQDYVPQYAPGGAAVVFQRVADSGPHRGAAALFVIGSDGSHIRRITPWGASSSSGSWASDGRIVFADPRDSLWTVASDGTGLTRIPVRLEGVPLQPRWSPDAGAIVFGLEVAGQTDIYTVRPDGSALTQVTDTPSVNEWWPDWNVGSQR